MTQLIARDFYIEVKAFPELSTYAFRAESMSPRVGMVGGCENVALLREHALYAFYTTTDAELVEPWPDVDIGCDPAYIASLPYTHLSRSISLTIPQVGTYRTLIVELGMRSADPFIHLMQNDDTSLLCLPNACSLDSIIEIFADGSVTAILANLLRDGGFVLTMIDDYTCTVQTYTTPA